MVRKYRKLATVEKKFHPEHDDQPLLLQLGVALLGLFQGTGRERNRLLFSTVQLVGEHGAQTIWRGVSPMLRQ